MNLKAFYLDQHGEPNFVRIVATVILFIVAFVIALSLWPLRTVPTGYRGVITVGGSIKSIQSEGFTLLWPWEKLDNFSIRADSVKIENAEGGTSDLQPVHVNLVVRYSIATDKVAEVFEKYTHTGDMDTFVETASHEVFKAVSAHYTAPDLISKRAAVSKDIFEALAAKTAKYGVLIINVDMTNFAFSKSYMDAINDKATQEQKRLASDNAQLTVASQERQKVIIAEAAAAAVKAKADGDAYATQVNAKAEAEATRVKGQATADAMRAQANAITANPDLIRMKIAEQWDGKLPQWMTPGAPLPLLSVDAPKVQPGKKTE